MYQQERYTRYGGDTVELDFSSIRALSSRTRIRILRELMRERMTPSGLSERLDASTSDVVLHLETLANAELVEEQPGEGFNTVYAPTQKAASIVDNSTTQVTFSIGSSAIAGLAGLAAIGQGTDILGSFSTDTQMQAAMESTAGSTGGMQAGAETAGSAVDPFLLVPGILLLVLCAGFLYYGIMLRGLKG